MNMKASALFQSKPVDRPLLGGTKGRSEASIRHGNSTDSFKRMLCLLHQPGSNTACRRACPFTTSAMAASAYSITHPGKLYCLQVALASFAFLFSEFVQYSQSQVSNIGELERRCGPWLQP